MFWIVVDRSRILLLVSALALPVLGLMAGRWWDARPHKLPASARLGFTGLAVCLFGMMTVPVLLFFAFCTPPPGEGVEARDGRERAAVIMTALDHFHARHHTFPDSLRILVPEWLPALALLGPAPRRAEGYPFEYVRGDSSYTLSFRYVGPGMNHCRISSLDRKWRCTGYF